MERLQKVIAHAGVASRRKAEQLILEGKVYRGLPPLYLVEYEDIVKGKKTKVKQYIFNDFDNSFDICC